MNATHPLPGRNDEARTRAFALPLERPPADPQGFVDDTVGYVFEAFVIWLRDTSLRRQSIGRAAAEDLVGGNIAPSRAYRGGRRAYARALGLCAGFQQIAGQSQLK